MDESYGIYVDDECFDIRDYDDDTDHDTDDDTGDDTDDGTNDDSDDDDDDDDDDADDGRRGNRRPLPGGAVYFPPAWSRPPAFSGVVQGLQNRRLAKAV